MADTTLTDPLGRSCTLHDYTWNEHVLRFHADMDGGRDFVEEAVRSPLTIWVSSTEPDVRIYYSREPTVGFMFAVKVNIKEGAVLTAHIVRKETGAYREWPLLLSNPT